MLRPVVLGRMVLSVAATAARELLVYLVGVGAPAAGHGQREA